MRASHVFAAAMVLLLGWATWLALQTPHTAAPTNTNADTDPTDPPAADARVRVPASGDAEPARPSDEPVGPGEPDEALREITVRVVDFEDAPVADAEVAALPGERTDPARGTWRTDSSGRVTVTVGAEDSIRVSAEAFATAWDEVEADEPTILVVLRPAYRISGRVVDADGRPVGDAVLSFDVPRSGWLDARSAADGSFAIRDIDAASANAHCKLHVEALGFAKWNRWVRPGSEGLRIVLRRPARLVCVVRLPDGRPAVKAGVRVRYADGSEKRAPTRGDGRAVFADVGSDHAWVTAGTGGSTQRIDGVRVRVPYAGPVRVDVPDGGTATVELDLQELETSYLALRVLTADGEPARHLAPTSSVARALGLPDATGRLVLAFSKPPSTRVQIGVQGDLDPEPRPEEPHWGTPEPRSRFHVQVDGITAATPDADAVEVRLPALEPVTIRVMEPDGQPVVEDEAVHVFVNATHRKVRPHAGDGPGVSRWRLAPGESLRLLVERQSRPRFRVEIPEWTAGDIVIRSPPLVEVRATIPATDADDRDVWGRIAGAYDESTLHATRAADGSVKLAGRAYPGGARVRVRAGSFVLVDREVRIPDRGPLDLGELRLPGVVTVRGRVSAPDDAPLGGARVWFAAGDERGAGTYTHADGTFAMRVPGSFDGTAVVTHADHAGSARRLREGDLAAPLDVRLDHGGHVRVIIRDSPPGLRGTTRYFVEDPRNGLRWQPEQSSIGKPYGVRRATLLSGVPAGRVLVGWGSDAWEFTGEVDVAAGETSLIELGLDDFRER